MRGKFEALAVAALLLLGVFAGIFYADESADAAGVGGDGTISGVISQNTTLTAAKSPYMVTGHATVGDGVTLTIDPGVTVKFDGYYTLAVNGTLVANGTVAAPITFTTNASVPEVGAWSGLYFPYGSDWQNSTVDHCRIEYAYTAIQCSGSVPAIHNNTIINNCYGVSAWAWYGDGDYPARTGEGQYNYTVHMSPLLIENNTVSHNKYTAIGVEGGYGGNAMVIRNNVVDDNGYGINCYGGNGTVANNHVINNNNYGISVYSYTGNDEYGMTGSGGESGNATSIPTLVLNNHISNNGHYGVYSNGNPRIIENDILDHVFGIYSYGVPEVHYNNIDGYGEHTMLASWGDDVINATYNWWGSANYTEISESIWDYHDVNTSNEVKFFPYLVKPILRDSKIVGVWPDHGGNTGMVTVAISGTGFPGGVTVKLQRSGYTDITAVNATTTHISKVMAKFNLSGAAAGVWDVVMILPNSTQLRLDDGFTVDEGGAAKLWVDVVGRTRIRAGGSGYYQIRYGNSGSVDAHDLLLKLTIPSWVGYTIDIPEPEGGSVNWELVSTGIVVGSQRIIPIWLYEVPAGTGSDIRLKLTATIGQLGQFIPVKAGLYQTAPTTYSKWGDADDIGTSHMFGALLNAAADVMKDNSDMNGTITDEDMATLRGILAGASSDIIDMMRDGFLVRGGHDVHTLVSIPLALTYSSDDVPVDMNITLSQFVDLALAKVLKEMCTLMEGLNLTLVSCAKLTLQVVWAVDPNEKAGPAGFGSEGYVQAGKEMRYVIHFENLANATASAQNALITDQLDPNLDWSSLELGETSHPHTYITEFDEDTGTITWTFWDLYLPPNVNPPEGEGWVTFTVRMKEGLASGTEIRNSASIVFDFNEPIKTPTVLNTVDAEAPVTLLTAKVRDESNIKLWWFADDGSGSGIEQYIIYRSVNGGDWKELLTTTDKTTHVIPGEAGNKYEFVCVAYDNLGQPVPFAEAGYDKVKIPLPGAGDDGTGDDDWWDDDEGTGDDGDTGDREDGGDGDDGEDEGDGGLDGPGDDDQAGPGDNDDLPGGDGPDGGDPGDGIDGPGGDGVDTGDGADGDDTGDDGDSGDGGAADGGSGDDGSGTQDTSGGDKEKGGDDTSVNLMVAAILVLAVLALLYMVKLRGGRSSVPSSREGAPDEENPDEEGGTE